MEHKHCLPDTPWHIGYVKKDEGDPRRHKARCVHINSNGVCKCPKSGCYTFKCNGSSHCKFYAETIEQWQSVRMNTSTIEEENAARIKERIRRKRMAFRRGNYMNVRHLQAKQKKKCPICDGFVRRSERYSQCIDCKSYFIDEEDYKFCSKSIHAKQEAVFITGRKTISPQKSSIVQKNAVSTPQQADANVYVPCKYSGNNGICLNKKGLRHGTACRSMGHSRKCTIYTPYQKK